ncbi:conserved hypothetical protein [Pediculus humanus corporis]|uniref:SREBP regulating gene protein n=1 Tax=Pediculus humanus subsp. corporis TaxID=121224 RepID=E0VKX3_PEDHC|nr:uncharacterized protein Phum_PHUM274810 [Pediculus humanus corporis]EEB14029.1 conserved hypothetical protein [Pediculus humanus corporis]
MWASFLLRIIRKRIVLALIFTLSLTYCVFSLWQEKITELSSHDSNSISIKKKLTNSFLWHSENDVNLTNSKMVTCRNSVQGKVLIVDDRGYVCSRSDLLSSGCCNTGSENTKKFACDTCKDNGCCSIYEYCISCCLHPDKKGVLQNVLGKESENVLFASVSDHFELCLAKCRTNSQSVHHENSYRDPRAKHCYGETPQVVLQT